MLLNIPKSSTESHLLKEREPPLEPLLKLGVWELHRKQFLTVYPI